MSSTIDILRKEYPGDANWARFVAVHRSSRALAKPWRELVRLTTEDIALVLAARVGNGAAAWLESPAPVLDGQTPIDVLRNEPDGERVIRHLLMRLPY
jgi:uncharacterized protein (DUF2384 family)